jgi:DNA-binding response OmpR family regulator
MTKKIMIVGDEKGFQDLYKVMFEVSSYDIIYVFDGGEAMQKVDEYNPDLIILDLLLDMLTGELFFLHLKSISKYKDIPVIIISAFPQSKFKGLKNVDPNLVYIEKFCLTEEILLEEVERKLKD